MQDDIKILFQDRAVGVHSDKDTDLLFFLWARRPWHPPVGGQESVSRIPPEADKQVRDDRISMLVLR